ncbi:hypothetical protein ACFX13_011708 [Malus domestica]
MKRSDFRTRAYIFSMFHASHHISHVPATPDEIKAEAVAVRNIAEGFCPLKIVLDKVVLTSTGVLLGCWQVTSGSDLITIREKLRIALPRAPEKQLQGINTHMQKQGIKGGFPLREHMPSHYKVPAATRPKAKTKTKAKAESKSRKQKKQT